MNEQFFPRILRSGPWGIFLFFTCVHFLMPPPCRAQVSDGHAVHGGLKRPNWKTAFFGVLGALVMVGGMAFIYLVPAVVES